jgi:hypothetical protein
VTRHEVAVALTALTTKVGGIQARLKRDTTPPTVPVIKATGGIKLLMVALTTPSTDAGGL